MYDKIITNLEKSPANNYTMEEAEILANMILKLGGYIDKNIVIPIINILFNLGFKIYSSETPKTILGNIFVSGNTKKSYGSDKIIIVSNKESLFSQRYIMAYELAYYLINYVGSEKYYDNNYTFSKAYSKIKHNSFDEIRADKFANELLMPKKIFLEQYLKAIKKSDYNNEYIITYLSYFFYVEQSCVKRRIIDVLSTISIKK